MMTHYTQADLDMADRHIAQGERLIVDQELLLARLQAGALPFEEADALLALLNSTQGQHRAHRVAIAEALAARR